MYVTLRLVMSCNNLVSMLFKVSYSLYYMTGKVRVSLHMNQVVHLLGAYLGCRFMK